MVVYCIVEKLKFDKLLTKTDVTITQMNPIPINANSNDHVHTVQTLNYSFINIQENFLY